MTTAPTPLDLDTLRAEVDPHDAGQRAHVTNREVLALLDAVARLNVAAADLFNEGIRQKERAVDAEARAEAAEDAVTRAYALADRWEHSGPHEAGLLRAALDGEPDSSAPLAHLNEPRVGRFDGQVLLIGGTYRKPLTPSAARNLADALKVNADSLDQPPRR